MPDDCEVAGLLALMLLTEARRTARVSASGELVTLGEQDRGAWDAATPQPVAPATRLSLRPSFRGAEQACGGRHDDGQPAAGTTGNSSSRSWPIVPAGLAITKLQHIFCGTS
jgi:hypothetical protein